MTNKAEFDRGADILRRVVAGEASEAETDLAMTVLAETLLTQDHKAAVKLAQLQAELKRRLSLN